jgi:hypothetical protein
LLDNGRILTIDPATGAGTLIGSTELSQIPGLAINSAGEIFATSHFPASDLYRIDAMTGAEVLIGSTGEWSIAAIAFDGDDVLYALSSANFGTINTSTGEFAAIGPAEYIFGGMAFDPTNGILWASQGQNEDNIYTIDKATGQATLIGQTGLGGSTPDLCFDAEGNLYGSKGGGQNPNHLISIDKSTGEGTVIGPIGFFSVSGLAARLDRVVSDIQTVEQDLPTEFALAQNHPNPFNPNTKIKYTLPEAVHVKLIIYDILGRQVRTLVSEDQLPGFKQTTWDSRNDVGERVGSGVYIYRIKAGSFTMARKLMLIR